MFGAGYLLLELAAQVQRAGDRITWDLLVHGSIVGLIFIGAAYALALLTPLDVVIDDDGVTYAGSLHRWRDVSAVTRDNFGVVLETAKGAVRLGPGTTQALSELEAQVRKRLLPEST
jgi:hypothetical protein